MRKSGIPPARIPEITWRKPNGISDSPLLTSKQTTTTPRRNESGEKKGETKSETRANVRIANVKRIVKQPGGCAQSRLSWKNLASGSPKCASFFADEYVRRTVGLPTTAQAPDMEPALETTRRVFCGCRVAVQSIQQRQCHPLI